MRMSQRAFDLIVSEEDGSEADYNKTEASTDYPGGASGVTIGIGYDCGYETAAAIMTDWGDKLPPMMIQALCAVAGIHGSPARSHAIEMHAIVKVSWEAALNVFQQRDVPLWEKKVGDALANCQLLSGDSFGALVSLAFNRGASFHLAGARYSEMREIAQLMAIGTPAAFAEIPDKFRAMKRLWPLGTEDHADLTARREHEAALFEQGLKQRSIRDQETEAAFAAGATVAAGE